MIAVSDQRENSSAAPASSEEATASSEPPTPQEPLPADFRVSRIAYAAPVMMLLTAVVLAGTTPWLLWTLLVPVAAAIWMWRLRTTVTPTGVHTVTLTATHQVGWDRVTGITFPKWGSVTAVLDDATKLRLPAVTFRDLPALSAASAGRIPDPYAAAQS